MFPPGNFCKSTFLSYREIINSIRQFRILFERDGTSDRPTFLPEHARSPYSKDPIAGGRGIDSRRAQIFYYYFGTVLYRTAVSVCCFLSSTVREHRIAGGSRDRIPTSSDFFIILGSYRTAVYLSFIHI